MDQTREQRERCLQCHKARAQFEPLYVRWLRTKSSSQPTEESGVDLDIRPRHRDGGVVAPALAGGGKFYVVLTEAWKVAVVLWKFEHDHHEVGGAPEFKIALNASIPMPTPGQHATVVAYTFREAFGGTYKPSPGDGIFNRIDRGAG